jgi:chaperonin cofactor prefoldin
VWRRVSSESVRGRHANAVCHGGLRRLRSLELTTGCCGSGDRRQSGHDGIARVAVSERISHAMMAGDARSDDRDGGRDDITRAVSALEASVASLTKRAEAAETRADQAENRAEQAETRADRAEQALSDAQNRVDRAEMGRDAERSPADELRDRIEALRVQLATAEADGSALTIETAELTAQLNQARRQAQEAQEAAEKKPSGGARGLLAGTAPSWAC